MCELFLQFHRWRRRKKRGLRRSGMERNTMWSESVGEGKRKVMKNGLLSAVMSSSDNT